LETKAPEEFKISVETDEHWDSSAFDKSLSRLANAKQQFRNKNSDYKGVLGRA
jgi:hypothetical protein